MTNPVEPTAVSPVVGVVGCGVTGQAVGRVLGGRGLRVAWFDVAVGAAVRASRRHGGVVLDSFGDLAVVDAVVLANPLPHAGMVPFLLDGGRDVISMSDDPADVELLLGLHELAVARDLRLVVGAALSPGLSGMLALLLAGQLHTVDEIHVATHGTGGPACARQHHDALGSRAIGWHDGEWIERPGGSGRDLNWFPEPIGPADCYRAALADPVVLHHAFPQADRITARVSATRRDRLTSRLPMMLPAHGEGDRGAVRVEVRGAAASGERITHVVGAVGRAGDMAGTVAALFASACLDKRCPPGVVVAGQHVAMNGWLLAEAVAAGVSMREFTGVARASEW